MQTMRTSKELRAKKHHHGVDICKNLTVLESNGKEANWMCQDQ